MVRPNNRYQQTLIDAVFFEQDQELQRTFRERIEKSDRRAQLTQVSGIQNQAVLDRLIELDVQPEALAALEIVPLVFVAWADGSVQPEEREVIVAAANAAGIKPQDGRYPLLEHWLNKRPPAKMLEAWKHYVKDLCTRLDASQTEKLKRGILDLARKVAQAAGGFLGFGDKTSTSERNLLSELEQSLS
jgi:hypothetical protein